LTNLYRRGMVLSAHHHIQDGCTNGTLHSFKPFSFNKTDVPMCHCAQMHVQNFTNENTEKCYNWPRVCKVNCLDGS
ncbi:unnamed protein product, partial [Dovyalis caffra]